MLREVRAEGIQLLYTPFIQVWDVKWPRGLRMLLPGPKDAAGLLLVQLG